MVHMMDHLWSEEKESLATPIKHDEGHHEPGATDVVIVSAFGRGEWLAGELAAKGWKVTLADVSESLVDDNDAEALTEAEGPFGLFGSQDLADSYLERFNEEGEMIDVERGVSLLLTDGPVELRGPLADHQLTRAGVTKTAAEYLRAAVDPAQNSKRQQRQLLQEPFRSHWLAGLAHQLTAPIFAENHRALADGVVAPIFASFSFRRPSPKGLEWSHQLLKARGVFVRHPCKVLDVRLTGKKIDAIEIQDGHGGIEQARSYVWMLTSGESRRFPEELFKKLFPGGATEPTWYWQRLRIDLEGERGDEALPSFFIMLGDVFLPWTHANLALFRKRREARAFDVWLKLPIRARFDGSYLERMASEIEAALKKRMPLLRPKMTVPGIAEQELAENPRWAIFSGEPYAEVETLAAENFFFCGPERWSSLDWLGAYRHQFGILGQLEKLKTRWDAEERRRKLREEREAAP